MVYVDMVKHVDEQKDSCCLQTKHEVSEKRELESNQFKKTFYLFTTKKGF